MPRELDVRDRIAGCLLGLALGDALGAPFEGGPLERLLWRLIGRTLSWKRRWTDDTQMSLDLAASLVANRCVDPDDLALRFAGSYRWSRGYGPAASKVLKRIARGMHWSDASRSVYPNGSFGNGGAMRAPVVGLYFATRIDELAQAARDSARVTHAHPVALDAAVLIAAATAKAFEGSDRREVFEFASSLCAEAPLTDKLVLARAWIDSHANPNAREVAKRLGSGMAAQQSCVTALYLATRFSDAPFTELIKFARRCGGDVDTISAMAGAIWGAANGCSALPGKALGQLEDKERLIAVARDLFESSVQAGAAAAAPSAPQLTFWQENIIDSLEDLADVHRQKRCWLYGELVTATSPEELLCQLFDDTTLRDRLEEGVSVFAPACDELLAELSGVVDCARLDIPPATLLRDSRWLAVVAKAKEALDQIERCVRDWRSGDDRTKVAKARFGNGLFFVEDRAGGEIPESIAGLVSFTSSCIAVGVLMGCDGETRVSLVSNACGAARSEALVFDGVIDTPTGRIAVFNVERDVLIEKRTAIPRTRVRIWANDDSEPETVSICVE